MIKVYVIHRAVHSVDDMKRVFCLGDNVDLTNIVFTNNNPDVVISTECVYNYPDCKAEFRAMYNNDRLNIMWCGEAIHPDFNVFDYVISYSSQYGGNNRHIRMVSPFRQWADFGLSYSENNMSIQQKDYFCNFIYSNANAHKMRDTLYNWVSEYKQVHSLGRHLNNTSSIQYLGNTLYGSTPAIQLKSPFKFSIAAENASFAGYTSEKLFTSLFAHTVPIYFGNPDVCKDVNPNSFINANNLTKEELIEQIREIDNNDDEWNRIVREPFQTKEQIEWFKKRDNDYDTFFNALFSGNLSRMKDCGFHIQNYVDSIFYNKYNL